MKSSSHSGLLFWLLFCDAQIKWDPIHLSKPTTRLVAEGSPCSLLPPSVSQQVPGVAGEDDCSSTHVIIALHTHIFIGAVALPVPCVSRGKFVFSSSQLSSQACLDLLCLILGTTMPRHRKPARLGTQAWLHSSNKTWLSVEGGTAAEALPCLNAVDISRRVAKPTGIFTLMQYWPCPWGAIAESSSPPLTLVYSNTVLFWEGACKHLVSTLSVLQSSLVILLNHFIYVCQQLNEEANSVSFY